MKAYVCDRCGDMMKQAPDNIVQINKPCSEDLTYHACDDCANAIAVYCAGNESEGAE